MSLYIMLLLANIRYLHVDHVDSDVMDKKNADPITNPLGFEMLLASKKTKSY